MQALELLLYEKVSRCILHAGGGGEATADISGNCGDAVDIEGK